MVRSFNFSSGNDCIMAFLDDNYSAVMVKIASIGKDFIDPVELTSQQAKALGRAVLELADLLEKNDISCI